MPCSYLSEGGSTYNKATIFLEEIVNKGEIFFAAPLQILNHYERTHEIIITPVYTTQTNSWNDISKAVKFFEFDIELYRVVGCEVGCASTFRALGLNS